MVAEMPTNPKGTPIRVLDIRLLTAAGGTPAMVIGRSCLSHTAQVDQISSEECSTISVRTETGSEIMRRVVALRCAPRSDA